MMVERFELIVIVAYLMGLLTGIAIIKWVLPKKRIDAPTPEMPVRVNNGLVAGKYHHGDKIKECGAEWTIM